MSSPLWKEKQKEQLRNEIILESLKLFEQKGLNAVSVDEITQKTGIAKGTFYLYFKSKADLIRAVFEEGLRQLEESVASAVTKKASDAREELRNVVIAQLEFFQEHGDIITLLLSRSGSASHDSTTEAWDENRARFRAATTLLYEEIIRRGQAQGCYRDVDCHLAAHALYGIITGLIYEAIESGRPFTDIEEIAVDIFERGVNRNA